MTHTLIVDSGSSKATWMTSSGLTATTAGINAVHSSSEAIHHILHFELPEAFRRLEPHCIHFYGAGVVGEAEAVRLQQALAVLYPKAKIEVCSDLLGAARALCGHLPGIACILGTGANSCLFDGRQIVLNVPPLGYILGDEGSGAVLGRRFIADLLKGVLPTALKQELFDAMGLDYLTIIRRVYREEGASRFLASFCPFIHEHLYIPEVESLVVDEFGRFFDRNVLQYPDARQLPVGFVGSVSHHFRAHLEKAATARGIHVGHVLTNPAEALIQYHSCKQP